MKDRVYRHISVPCNDNLQYCIESINILNDWILSFTDWGSFEDWWEVLRRVSDWMAALLEGVESRKKLLQFSNAIESLLPRSLILQVVIMSSTAADTADAAALAEDDLALIDDALAGIKLPLQGVMCRRSFVAFLSRKKEQIPISRYLNEFISINRLSFIDPSLSFALEYPLQEIQNTFPATVIDSVAIPKILCHALATDSSVLQRVILSLIFKIFPFSQWDTYNFISCTIDALSQMKSSELSEQFYPLLFESIKRDNIDNVLPLICSSIEDCKISHPYDILSFLLSLSPSSAAITEKVFSLAIKAIEDPFQMNRLVDRVIPFRSLIGPSFIGFLGKLEYSSKFPRAILLLENQEECKEEKTYSLELCLMIQIELFPHRNDLSILAETVQKLFFNLPSSPVFLESCSGPITSLLWLKKYFSTSSLQVVKKRISLSNSDTFISMETFIATATDSTSNLDGCPFLLPFVFPNGPHLFLALLLKERLSEDSSLFGEILEIFEDVCTSSKEQLFVYNLITSSILLIDDSSFDAQLQRISYYPRRFRDPEGLCSSMIFKDILRKSSCSKTLLCWWKNVQMGGDGDGDVDLIYEVVLWFKLGNGRGDGMDELAMLVLTHLLTLLVSRNGREIHKDLFERWNSIEGVPKILLYIGGNDCDGCDSGDNDDPWK